METTEEILNKLLKRIEGHRKCASSCEDERRFWAERGNSFLAEAWKCMADWHRKQVEETEKCIESAIKEKEDD